MIKGIIRKKHFRRLHAQLKGAKKLRNEEQPLFVYNACAGLTEINLELKQSDFPKALVGSHADICEVLLRQILLIGFYKICPSVMQSLGSGKTFNYPLPQTWIKNISDNGVPSSFFISRIFLLLSSMKKTIYGFAKFCILLSQRMNPVNPGCPYVVFLGLRQNNLPSSKHEKSYDIISWYNKSIIKKSNISKIWAQAKVKENYIAPTFLIIVSRTVFPRFNHLKSYLQFIYKGIAAFIVAMFGILRGKWWYGYLYPEAIDLHYVNALKRECLAEEYFFNNSNWFYKPLWSYEIEKMGSTVSLYYYSTNMEIIQFNHYKEEEVHGSKIMSWNRFIVWDQQQEDYLKQYCPNATYIKVGSLDFTGIEYKSLSFNNKKIISVFDVTPTRLSYYVKLGYAIPPYYSEELNLKFLSTIIDIFNDDDWEILWKPKRLVTNEFASKIFKEKQNNLLFGSIIRIDPNISAKSLVKASDAVISMPFTSTSLIAKYLGVPSIYYDASGKIQQNTSHNISVLKNSYELLKWKLSLNNNKTVNSVV